MRIKIPLLIFATLIFCSCVSTKAIKIGTSNHPATFWQKVVVYKSIDQIPGRYEELALLSLAGDTFAGTQDILISMKKKAAKLGANAIIIRKISSNIGQPKVLVLRNFLIIYKVEKLICHALAIHVFSNEKK